MASLFTTITAESPGTTPFEFSSVSVESGNTFAPSSTQAHGGSQSYEAAFGGSNDGAFAWREFTSASNEVYISFWIYISSDFSFQYGDSYGYICIIMESAHGANPITIQLYSTTAGAPDRWRVTGVDLTQTDSATNFSLGAWHNIEMYYLAGASENGIARVWVDDDLIFEDTAVTSDYLPDYVRIGYSVGAVAAGSEIYFDDISGEDEIPAGGTAHQATIQDSVGITDSLSRSIGRFRTIEDEAGITDLLSVMSEKIRSITDTVSISDTVSRIGSFFRSLSNTVGVSDTLTRIGRFIRSITDALGITDSITSDSSNRTYPSYITAEVVLVSQYTAEIIKQ
jgi:hypothetical protein